MSVQINPLFQKCQISNFKIENNLVFLSCVCSVLTGANEEMLLFCLCAGICFYYSFFCGVVVIRVLCFAFEYAFAVCFEILAFAPKNENNSIKTFV